MASEETLQTHPFLPTPILAYLTLAVKAKMGPNLESFPLPSLGLKDTS